MLCVARVDTKEPEQFAHVFPGTRNELFENEHADSIGEVFLKSLDPIGIEPAREIDVRPSLSSGAVRKHLNMAPRSFVWLPRRRLCR